MAGWIYVPGTSISYPVLVSADDHYLYRDIDGKKDYHGSIYTRHMPESGNDLSNQSMDNSHNDNVLVLFGHNMRDGTMFAGLHRFRKEDFARDHRYAWLYTDDGWIQYELESVTEQSAEDTAYEYAANKYTAHDYTGIAGISSDNRQNDTKSGNSNPRLVMITCSGKDKRLVTSYLLK